MDPLTPLQEVAANFSDILAMARNSLSLLSEFPLNIIVTLSIAGGVFALIKKGKRVAG